MTQRIAASLEFRTDRDDDAVDITPFVKSFVWKESMIHGGFMWELEFLSDAWEAWDALIFGRDNPTYQFRLATEADGSDKVVSTPWLTAISDRSKAEFSQDASMRGKIVGADRRLLLAQLPRTRVFDNTTASDILRRIAQEHGLNADIADTGVSDSWTQVRENDWAFCRRVAREAVTQAGRCDTYLWLEENTLRFGAPDVTAPSARQYDMSVVEARVDGWVGTYHGRHADRQGAARLRGVGFDFEGKTGIVFDMDSSAATSQPSLAARVPRRMADGLRIFSVTETTPEQVEQAVRARWGRYAPRYLGIRVFTRPDPMLRPNKVVSLQGNIDSRRQTPFSGRYACVEVEHIMSTGGALETSITCYRREAGVGEENPTGVSAENTRTQDPESQGGGVDTTVIVAQELA